MKAAGFIAKVLEGTDPCALVNVLAEGEGKHLDRLPSSTEVHDGGQWSEWDGKLAMVYGPDYYSINKEAGESFDPAMMTRRYAVRFATDGHGKRLSVPDKKMIGQEVVVQNRSAQYWQTVWTFKPYGGYGSYGPSEQGTFEKDVEVFWVTVKAKDLGPAEVRAVARLYDSYGYKDISDYQKLNISLGDWKKVFSHRKFKDTQDLPSDLANAAYELLLKANGHKDPRDETDEQIVWDSIQGVYKTTKKGTGLGFILKK